MVKLSPMERRLSQKRRGSRVGVSDVREVRREPMNTGMRRRGWIVLKGVSSRGT